MDWSYWDQFESHPSDYKKAVEAFIEDVLNKFHTGGREPNSWESEKLAGAIEGACHGRYRQAVSRAGYADRPELRRSNIALLPSGTYLSLRELEGKLADLKRLKLKYP